MKAFFHRNPPKNMFIQEMNFDLETEKKAGILQIFRHCQGFFFSNSSHFMKKA